MGERGTHVICRRLVRRSYRTGEVVYRGLNFAHQHPVLYKLINLLQHFLINPNLTARRTHVGRYVLEQVNIAVSLLLVGDGGCLELTPTDSSWLFLCVVMVSFSAVATGLPRYAGRANGR